jgi:D-alanyl-D-alanine carboxypeptidase
MFKSRKVRRAQTAFLPPFTGGEPPGPGQNRDGLTLYRYRVPCGVVFGHSGNFPGYTQWIASSPDGSRSAVVTANLQLSVGTGPPGVFTPLRKLFKRAACAALAG